jgi:DNA-binding response OmpR family regulator
MENAESANPADKLVLIVDDDEAFSDLMEFVVGKERFRTERAADGEAGLWKAQHISPDLILLDLMLPKFGGFEIMRELQNGETAGIPIIIITGRYTENAAASLIKKEYNVRKFLEKPVTPQVLVAALHNILGTRRPEPPMPPPPPGPAAGPLKP